MSPSLSITPPHADTRSAWASRAWTRPAFRLLCFVVAAGGVVVAVTGMLWLSLPLMGAGTALWILGVIGWERATGRFH